MERPVVLVTGTSSGIGREAALALHRTGAQVVATARDERAISGLAAAGMATLRLDVTDAAQRQAAVAATLARHGRIDALVNNAGWGAMVAVEETTPDLLRGMLETNLVGLHELTRLVLPGMRAQRRGRIVNVSSIAGHVPVPLMGAYCATKFGLRALTQCLDMEARGFGVRTTPGFGNRSVAETRSRVDVAASPYAAMYASWMRRRERRAGRDAGAVARAIVRAVMRPRPRLHHFVPWQDAWLGNLGKRLLPDAVTLAGLRAYFHR